MASAVVVVGFVASATPAFAASAPAAAPDNVITSNASCNSPLGTGSQITWTIANNANVSDTGAVTAVTGGLGTLHGTTYSIPASPGLPSQTATLTQTLPAGATGSVTLDVSSTWSDGSSRNDSGTFDLSTISCGAPDQTIAGHIYLCNNGNPTTTEQPGGTVAASGPGLSTVPATPNPSAPTNVTAGTYTMTATNPPGFQLVACNGSSSSNGAGTSAAESVSVPSGGAGAGLFYVNPVSPPGSPNPPVSSNSPISTNPPVSTNAPSSTTWSSSTSQSDSIQPSIKLKKSASITSFSAPGTPVTYSYKVTNTGNVTLDPVVVTDPMAGLSAISCPDTSLASWASETCTATYTTTQGDLDHGSISNTGTATGTAPNWQKVTATSSVCIPACRYPSIKLKKSASVALFSAPGTLVTYSYKVTNTGNVTLDPVVVTDPMAGLSAISCPDTSLDSWASETCTATYTTTQSDVDQGSLCNTGTATGTAPNWQTVQDQSSVCIPAGQSPSISVVKTASVTSFSAPGTLVTYSYKVTNTGNVTLDPVVVTDPMAGLSAISCPDTSLAPSMSETCTATYTTTQSDVDQGSLCNTGTATGTAPNWQTVQDQSSVCIPAGQSPSISVVKTADVPTVSAVGQVVTYTFTVTNTGNVTLHNVDVTDAQAAPSLDKSLGPITCATGTNGSITLAPGATDTCSATYTVTQADLTNNSIDDTATVTGQPPSGPPVTGTSSLSLTVTSVTVVKAASPSGGVVAGSTTPIVYTLTVTNTGSATTTAPIVVTDSAPTGTTLVASSPACATGGPPTCTVGVNGGTIAWTIPSGVAPGASYTLTYSVTANSNAPNPVTNTASFSGPGCGPPAAVTTTTCMTNTVRTPVTAPPVPTPAVPTPPVSTQTTFTPPAPVPMIAFTGAFLSREWTIGVAALWLGAGLVVLARWRRRSPKAAAR